MAMMPGRLFLHSLVCCLFLANLGITLGFTPMARLPNLICSEATNKKRNIQIPALFFPKHKTSIILSGEAETIKQKSSYSSNPCLDKLTWRSDGLVVQIAVRSLLFMCCALFPVFAHADIDEVKPVVEKLQQVIKVDVKPYQEDKSSNQKAESTVDRAKRKPLMDKIQSPLVPDANGQCMPGFHSKVTEGSAAEPARKVCWPNSLKAAENGVERMVLDAEEQAFLASSDAVRRAQSVIRVQEMSDRIVISLKSMCCY